MGARRPARPQPGGDEWLVCRRTAAELARVGDAAADAVATADPLLRAAALHVLARGGKRLRPALLLCAARFGRGDVRALLRAAAAIEMIHVASLHHDDVMDRAPERRGEPSANARWGNAVAVVAGTYLFSRAAVLLESLDAGAYRLAIDACDALHRGQMAEVENAYDVTLSEREHLAVLAGKTASLFELPCRLGAELSGAEPGIVDTLAAYGRDVGLAFQLTDDVLDVAGEADALGKATGHDLREGIYGLPVLRLLARDDAAGAEAREILSRSRLGAAEIERVRDLARACGAVDEAREVALVHARRAEASLSALPDGPARASLYRLAAFAVRRAH